LNKRRARRVVHARELRGKHLEAVEGVEIAEKLCCPTLVIDNRFGNTWEARVFRETGPGAATRALQVDRGDLPVSCGWTRTVEFYNRAHAAAAKRGFRLPRPVLANVETMVLTTMSG
jgi:hypothetical protein